MNKALSLLLGFESLSFVYFLGEIINAISLLTIKYLLLVPPVQAITSLFITFISVCSRNIRHLTGFVAAGQIGSRVNIKSHISIANADGCGALSASNNRELRPKLALFTIVELQATKIDVYFLDDFDTSIVLGLF